MQPASDTDRSTSAGAAAFLLLTTSAVWACTPLLVSLLDGQRNPVGYTIGYELASVAAIYVYGRRKDPLFGSAARLREYLPSRKTFWRNTATMREWPPCEVPLVNWQVALTLLVPVSLLLYTYSVRLIPSVVAAVLFEAWPVAYFVLHRIAIPQRHKISPLAVPLFLLILCGVAGVIFSSTPEGDSVLLSGLLSWETVTGSAMMLAASALLATGVYKLAVADIVAESTGKKAVLLLEYGFVTQILGVALTGLLSALLGPPDWKLLLTAFLVGLPVLIIGNASNAEATARITQQPKLIALRYTTPAFSVLLLWAVGDYAAVNTTTLLLGMALIVVGNAMLNIADRQQTDQPAGL